MNREQRRKILDEVKNTPEYQEYIKSDKRIQKAREDYYKAEAPIIEDLKANGFSFDHIEDILKEKYPLEIIPIAIKWIPKVDNWSVKIGLIELLAVKGAGRELGLKLIEEFKKARNERAYGFMIGDYIRFVMDKSLLNEVVGIAKDKKYGTNRQMIVNDLHKFKKEPGIYELLLELIDDQDVEPHAIFALGKLGNPDAIPHLEKKLTSSKNLVKSEAKKAIAKLERLKK